MELLREAIAKMPQSPELAHALGLALVRSGDRQNAIDWLRQAAELGQEDPRYAFVYAVALHDTGQAEKAVSTLQSTLLRHPYDRNLLNVLLSYRLESGNLQGAVKHAETLAALEPGNRQIQSMLAQIRQAVE